MRRAAAIGLVLLGGGVALYQFVPPPRRAGDPCAEARQLDPVGNEQSCAHHGSGGSSTTSSGGVRGHWWWHTTYGGSSDPARRRGGLMFAGGSPTSRAGMAAARAGTSVSARGGFGGHASSGS